jgi:hypothetical protein
MAEKEEKKKRLKAGSGSNEHHFNNAISNKQ